MADGTSKKKYLSQSEVPRVSVQTALKVPKAIADNYAKEPTPPFDVATALDLSPNGRPFREMAGAAVAYGMTTGGPKAQEIGLTDIGRRLVAPLKEGDDRAALGEAVLVPNTQKAFLEKYNESPVPEEKIARNVLESMGVPEDATDRALETILDNAKTVGFLIELKGKTYVRLRETPVAPASLAPEMEEDEELGDAREQELKLPSKPPASLAPNRRVFISHGKNKRIVEQLKDLLTFGDFEPIVSVEKETVAKPISQKVFDDMRSCSAGIIHVSPEQRLMDQEGNEHLVLNQNVLIEIGAAMALYPNRFILLVEEGTTLPSNLQGLYEVRYEGDELGYDATMRVLKALTQFKTDSTEG